jgi:uncharacterized protein (TIGR03067 family)
MRHMLIPLCLVLSAGHLHAQDSTAARLAALQGDWTLVSAAARGQAISPPPGIRHVVGDTVTVTINSQVFMQAIFKLDPSTTPHSIDYNVIGGTIQGEQLRGVYKLEGNRLTICMGGPSGRRANDFEAAEGEEGSCSVWEKK